MLKQLISGNAYIHPRRKTNWDSSERYRPAIIHKPTSLEQVVAIVKHCAASNRKLFPIGSLHSRSLQLSQGVQYDFIDLREMNEVLSFDPETRIVEAQAGAKIRKVNKHLLYLDKPFMLQGTGSTQEQTLAGAASNSTNPYSGGRWVSISGYIKEIELVDGEGNVHVLTDSDGDIMRAARVSLGLLGVITRLKLEAQPAFIAKREFAPVAEENVLEAVDEAMAATDDFAREFGYFAEPHMFTSTIVRPATKEEAKGLDQEKAKVFYPPRSRSSYMVLTPLLKLSRRFARLWQRRLAHPVGFKSYSSRDKVTWSTHIFENDDSIFSMAEFYIPKHRFAEFLQALPQMYKAVDDPYVHPWFKFRPQRRVENTLLSPAQGQDCVTILMGACPLKEKYREAYMAYEQFFVSEFDARTHWGCPHAQKSQQLFRGLYGENFDRFVAVRRQLDPNNMFLREPDKTAFK